MQPAEPQLERSLMYEGLTEDAIKVVDKRARQRLCVVASER